MLLGGAILPPAETLIVEDELLPEGPIPPPVEGGLAVSEEVLPPPLLVGKELFGAGANPRFPDEVLEGESKAR